MFSHSIISTIIMIILYPVVLAIGWLFQRSATLSALKKYEIWKNTQKSTVVKDVQE